MIRRIYIDNYKCFSNFEWKPGSIQLMLGKNGSGKTTILDVLERLRGFIVNGIPAPDAFPTDSLTKWDDKTEQRFELDIEGNGGLYSYRLVVKHDRVHRKKSVVVVSEKLSFNQSVFYGFVDGELFFPVDENRGCSGPMPYEQSRSPMSTIPEREDFQLLTWFRNRIQRIYIFSPNPLRMKALTTEEVSECDRDMHQLASWLRHLSQEAPPIFGKINKSLEEVIGNLVDFKLAKASEAARLLTFNFGFVKTESASSSLGIKPVSFILDQLSTGQKSLVALFTILHAAVQKDATVCIDEPDNYVALREIQPWLIQLEELVEENDSQCFLVSHHPELINSLAADHGELFYREEGGIVRAKKIEWTGNDVLLPAEIIAREWE